MHRNTSGYTLIDILFVLAIVGLVIVGGPQADSPVANNTGKAYLYDLATGQELRTFLPNDPVANDTFGTSVGISGGRAIVGSPYDDHGAVSNEGSAYLFDVATGAQLAPHDQISKLS